MSWDSEETIFQVVINHEEQYSIWPEHLTLPQGWRLVGVTGKKQQCLDYVQEHWTDMRPLSLRRHMAESAPQSKQQSKQDTSRRRLVS